jgi:PAS domain S-box-containing protein
MKIQREQKMTNPLQGKSLLKKSKKILPKKRKVPQKISSADMERLIHEFELHQVELEMQNQELRKAQEKIEKSRCQYVGLYDLAPMGYLTLDEKGAIREVNLAGASLLGIERRLPIKLYFPLFIMPEDRDLFRDFHRKVLRIPGRQSCELRLKRGKNDLLWVRLEGVAVGEPDGKLNRVRLALMDISDRKRAEEEVLRLNAEMEVKATERTAQLEAANKALKDQIARQEQADEEILRSEKEFRGIFELSSVGMAEKDPLTRALIRVNQRLCEMTGYSAKELLNQMDTMLTHPDDRERDQEVQKDVLKGKSTKWAIEKRYVRKDGEVIWVHVNGRLIRDSSGQPYRTVAVIQDITERKKAEELLHESEERNRNLVKYAPAAIYEMDIEGTKFLSVNDAMCKILKYTREELLALRPADLLGQESRFLFRERIRKKLAGEEIGEVEYRVRSKDGQWINAVVNVGMFTYTDDKPSRVVVIAHDITERKRMEEELRRSETILRAVLDHTPDPIFLKDRESRILLANPATFAVVGKPEMAVIGKTDAEFYDDPATGRAIMENDRRIMDSGKMEVIEETVLDPAGTRIYLSTKAPYRDVEGRVIGLVGVTRDITERKWAEEALRKAKDELEVRIQERTEELAKSRKRLQQLATQLLLAQEKERKRVAMELHDGLLSELAATKYLLEGKVMQLDQGKPVESGELRRVADILAGAMKEARRLMNNLHPSILDELGLIATIDWLCGEYQRSYPHIAVEKEIAFSEKDIAADVRVVIYRILQEALNNFARHGKGNRVALSLSKSDGTFALAIRDNGQGFDLAKVQKGLGLESMKERVELSGGEFQIESGIGQGTTIRAIWST